MAKDEFDMNFDFEKEYGFDPSEFLDQDDNADIDFSQFEDEQVDADLPEDEFSDFSLDDLNLEAYGISDDDFQGEGELQDPYAYDAYGQAPGDEQPYSDYGQPYEQFPDAEEQAYQQSVNQGPDVIGGQGGYADYREEEADFDATDFAEEDFEGAVYGRPAQDPGYAQDNGYQQPQYPQEGYPEGGYPEGGYPEQPQYPQEEFSQPGEEEPADGEASQEKPQLVRRERRRDKPAKVKKEKDPNAGPGLFEKLLAAYLAPLHEEPAVDPNNPRRRRRKKTKSQIFKEVYLPPIIAGVTLVLMLVFVIGSITNLVDRKKQENDAAIRESQSAQAEADRLEQQAAALMEQAQTLAMGYDYQAAFDLLGTFQGEMPQEMVELRAEYQQIQSRLVEHKNYSSIPNLRFHNLIADLPRALADTDYGGSFNKNFVTTDEFEKILEQLYQGGYVLVDFDSFTSLNEGLDGSANFFTEPIALPEGKKPVMITQTQVNYYNFMVDSNDDKEPDKGGSGFAFRLVVDEQGDIRAQMVDSEGQTQTGNFDLVPILEDFIKAHPDFSYRGARATLAVSGYEGIFGYRCTTSYISSVSQAYYDEQVAGAKVLVEALRNKGYTIACYTFNDKAYGDMSATQIQSDMQEWTNQITPVVGQVDTLVYAKTSDIGDYSGTKYTVLSGCGFRYFLRHGTQPNIEVNNTFVKQTCLMVTGENMVWQSSMFSGIFDCNAVLNNQRGNVPKTG